MKSTIQRIVLIVCTVALASCASNPSLQKYYIDNSDNQNFITMDIPSSLFSLKQDAPKELVNALESIDKLNILAFVKKDDNEAAYAIENQKVKAIMKNAKYQELIRVKHDGSSVLLKYEGGEDDKTLDEVIVYATNKDMGFALVRILGNDMNPADMMKFAQNIDSFDFSGSELGDFMSKIEKKVVER